MDSTEMITEIELAFLAQLRYLRCQLFHNFMSIQAAFNIKMIEILRQQYSS